MAKDEGGGASRSTDPAAGTSAATDVSLREHFAALLEANDRRYTEIAQEREKALRIKEDADKAALALAREIQAYKDEKANELRAQIESERGRYPTRAEHAAEMEKLEATIKPLVEYITAQQGQQRGITGLWGFIVGAIGVVGIVVAVAVALAQ